MDNREYQREWARRYRQQPFFWPTRDNRRRFRQMQEDIAEGRCIYCGIFKDQAPNHDCLNTNISVEIIVEWVERVIL